MTRFQLLRSKKLKSRHSQLIAKVESQKASRTKFTVDVKRSPAKSFQEGDVCLFALHHRIVLLMFPHQVLSTARVHSAYARFVPLGMI